MRSKPGVFVMAALLVGACADSGDPADGGFLAGVSGIAGGGYQARLDERQAEIDRERARAAGLQAERASVTAQSADVATQITALQNELAQLRLAIADRQARLRAAGVRLDSRLQTRISAALTNEPGGSSDAERLASLQAAVSEARALSEALQGLSR